MINPVSFSLKSKASRTKASHWSEVLRGTKPSTRYKRGKREVSSRNFERCLFPDASFIFTHPLHAAQGLHAHNSPTVMSLAAASFHDLHPAHVFPSLVHTFTTENLRHCAHSIFWCLSLQMWVLLQRPAIPYQLLSLSSRTSGMRWTLSGGSKGRFRAFKPSWGLTWKRLTWGPRLQHFPRETCPRTPLLVEHLWWVGACIMMSEKVHFLINTSPLPRLKAWPPACLLPCYHFSHTLGRAALAERLLAQLLSSRSEKYECTHRGRWGKTPATRISGCHSAILNNKTGYSCQPRCTWGMRLSQTKNTAPCLEDLLAMLSVCHGNVFSNVTQLVLTGATSTIGLAGQERRVSALLKALQKSTVTLYVSC